MYDSNNECIFKEQENPTIDFETSTFNNLNIYSENVISKNIHTDEDNINSIEKETISSNINTIFETSSFENNKENSDSSKLNDKTPNEASSISIDLESDYLNYINNDKERSSLNKMDRDKATSISSSILTDKDIDTSSLKTIINSDNLNFNDDNETSSEISSYEHKEIHKYSSFNTIEAETESSLFSDINSNLDNSNIILLNSTDTILLNDNDTHNDSSLIENNNNNTFDTHYDSSLIENNDNSTILLSDIYTYYDSSSIENNNNTTFVTHYDSSSIENNNNTTLLSDIDTLYDSSLIENNKNTTLLSDIDTHYDSSLIENNNTTTLLNDIDSSLIENNNNNTQNIKIINTNSEIFSSIIMSNKTEESECNTVNISEEINENGETQNSFMEFDFFFNNDSKNVSEFFENNFIFIAKNDYLTNINSLINNYNHNNSDIEIKSENNYTIYCYSSKSDINNLIRLNPNLYFINLKECGNKLIKENDLDENSDLLIIINDQQNNRSNFFYEIYTRNGVKISDLSVCENTKIEVSSPIFNLKEANYEKAIILHNQGYDIYNMWSNFYYDFCTSAYIEENDLTLNVRQQEIFPNNVSICMNGCSYNGIDLDIKRFYCLCSPNLKNNEDKSENKSSFEEVIDDNFFIYIADMINYQIFSCYILFFEIKNYFYNFGFYYAFGINFINIILLFIYLIVGRKKIKVDFLHHEPNVAKRKEIEKKFNTKLLATNIKDNRVTQHPKNSNKKHKRKTKKIQTHTIKNYNLLKSYSNPVKKKKIFESKKEEKKRKTEISKRIFEKRRLKLLNRNQSDVYFENSKDKVFKSKEIFEKVKFRNHNLLLLEKTENKDKIDYNELSYYEALQRDNRSILNIFFSVFNLKIEIIQLSFYSKEFSHKSLTLPLYLFDLLLDLTINALLFSDDIISQKYYNNGKLKMLTSHTLSLISILLSNIVLYFARILINNYDILNAIIRDIKNKNDYYRIFIKISCILKLRTALFFFLIIIIEITCMYYLFIFCAIYKKIQKNLLINYIIGSCWQLVYSIVICFLIAILRKLSLIKKIKRLYIISRFIDEKL